MKKKDLVDLKNKSAKELAAKAQEISKSIVDIRLEMKLGKVNNVHSANAKRKELAKVLTIHRDQALTEKESSKATELKAKGN